MDNESKEVRIISNSEFVILEALREAREHKKAWEEQEQRCRQALLSSVGDADMLYYDGKYVASIETRSQSRFNRKLFAKDWPRLDEEYRTEVESKVINLIGEVEHG